MGRKKIDVSDDVRDRILSFDVEKWEYSEYEQVTDLPVPGETIKSCKDVYSVSFGNIDVTLAKQKSNPDNFFLQMRFDDDLAIYEGRKVKSLFKSIRSSVEEYNDSITKTSMGKIEDRLLDKLDGD